jgi:hypothetical protein
MTERERLEIPAQKALARAEVQLLRILRERDISATKAAKVLRAAEKEASKLRRETERELERNRKREEKEEYDRKEAAKSFGQLLNDVHERYEAPILARDSKGRFVSIKKAKETKETERDTAIRAIAERFGIPRNEVWHQYFSPSFK